MYPMYYDLGMEQQWLSKFLVWDYEPPQKTLYVVLQSNDEILLHLVPNVLHSIDEEV